MAATIGEGMTDLLAIVKAWPDAEGDENRHHRIRQAVRKILSERVLSERKTSNHSEQATFDAAIAAASATATEDAAWACFKDVSSPTPDIAPVVFLPSSAWRQDAPPAPIIWRDHNDFADAVLSVGEVAVLAGAGKGGKILPLRRVGESSRGGNPRGVRKKHAAYASLPGRS